MRKIYYVFENHVRDLCPSVRDVNVQVVQECDIKDINYNTDEINVVFYESDKLILNVYTSEDITVREIQKMINEFKFFKINLEFIKYNTIPFTNLCVIEFEVCSNE